jgi:hypothetical protein
MLDGVEPPPSSFLLSDPLLLVLGGACLLRLPQLARGRLLDLRATVALTIGFSIPAFLMLMFCGMTFGYRMEFYLLIEFAAFLRFYAICVNPDESSVLLRGRLSLLLIASAGFGIVCSQLLLFLYKISPATDRISTLKPWIDLYFSQLWLLFPSIAQRLHL